jgi:hypothetical protein
MCSNFGACLGKRLYILFIFGFRLRLRRNDSRS